MDKKTRWRALIVFALLGVLAGFIVAYAFDLSYYLIIPFWIVWLVFFYWLFSE